jgi:hypothetical protein
MFIPDPNFFNPGSRIPPGSKIFQIPIPQHWFHSDPFDIDIAEYVAKHPGSPRVKNIPDPDSATLVPF